MIMLLQVLVRKKLKNPLHIASQPDLLLLRNAAPMNPPASLIVTSGAVVTMQGFPLGQHAQAHTHHPNPTQMHLRLC
jgi:hypothetical protein